MFNSILVVCVGNICRSPVGERVLQAALPNLIVSSAGVAALVGNPADPDAASVAAERGISLDGHSARQFTAQLGASHDLILTMEPGHRAEIIRMYPQLSGKTMLFDQWSGAKGIEDPYLLSQDVHRKILDQILVASEAWVSKLSRKK